MSIHGSHTDFYLLLIDQLRTQISSDSFIGYNSQFLHYKNKIVKMTNVSVVRNSRKCNLIVRVGCYDCMVTCTNYNPIIIIAIPLSYIIMYKEAE